MTGTSVVTLLNADEFMACLHVCVLDGVSDENGFFTTRQSAECDR